MLAKLIALVVHEIVTEYRKLDRQPETSDGSPRYDPASTTSVVTERAEGWDHDKRPPVTARFGFGTRETQDLPGGPSRR
jgi:hypothetical protein